MSRSLASAFPVALAAMMVAGACSSSGESSPTATDLPSSSAPSEVDSQAVARVPVIVDYSPTVSDVGALLYLLSHPGVDVLAITLPVTGEAGCELGLEVTFGILAMFERDNVPVACDPELPNGAEQWPGEFLAGHESLSSGLPAVADTAADPRPAHQLIADVAAGSDRPVILFAVAPLTNVARALDRHPSVAGDLDRLAIMGGAIDAPGNVGGTDAEWNFWIDVAAAVRVFDSTVPITLVPLDATNDVPVPGSWQRDLREAEQSVAISYLRSLVQAFPAVTGGLFYLWDELAASVAAGDGLVTAEELNLLVVEQPGPSYGSVTRDLSGTPVLMASAVPDSSSFYTQFLMTLAGARVDPGAPFIINEESAPTSVASTSSPEEVLAYWMIQASTGDVAAAASVVAPDAAWVGFGDSPDVFAEGAEPYDTFDIEVECTSDKTLALCDMTWNDVWISVIPNLERGGLRVQAESSTG